METKVEFCIVFRPTSLFLKQDMYTLCIYQISWEEQLLLTYNIYQNLLDLYQ
ncbi:hypothetical protein TTHERM_000131169 (macronuclear) [Tetrahymena thermophila SB210]|uniref:Uncharacterized protein n=1 Tax=Tetrahymena thermophila (strain SB210) TaxID=312017 RepID=W7XAR7_TETTS|nr:hypothetical protein TTHERM_000131169 [Tetrahymena thermophila SB210]EWS73513.1 hypothetical protein TTHERM_000131169 [Tetrahymena thermophila SB210]|eukprot:XP_012653995.1 hypothetical protein TTHERM_000131169 [Tetrahymena thermophila SB210]